MVEVQTDGVDVDVQAARDVVMRRVESIERVDIVASVVISSGACDVCLKSANVGLSEENGCFRFECSMSVSCFIQSGDG